MTRFAESVALSLALSAFASVPSSAPRSTLLGIPTMAACPTDRFFASEYPVLILDKPIEVTGLGTTQLVELIFNEPEFLRFGEFAGKPVSVECYDLGPSHLCGPDTPRATCGVSSVHVIEGET
jgi:hypothetical protein